MIKIEYWNTYDILDVHYEGGYKNWFWLDVDVMKPTYVVEREANENSLGEAVNVFLKWAKQYTFDVYCLEPLADALTTITLHDNVWVTLYDNVWGTLSNGYSAKVKDFIADVQWTEIPNLAKVTVSFVTKTYMVKGSSSESCAI